MAAGIGSIDGLNKDDGHLTIISLLINKTILFIL
jgi:hypothetical protein